MRTTGQLITLDRTYPLVRIADQDLRAEYAASFSRDELKATVGDLLELERSNESATPQIIGVLPRETLLARRLCLKRPSVGEGLYEEHLLAANFDRVFVVVALGRRSLDLDYLEKQLVAAYESGGKVVVVLNKSDLVTGQHLTEAVNEVARLADGLEVVVCSTENDEGIAALRDLCPEGSTSVFFGRSGVGKSSLINALIGSDDLATGKTRERDQAGRHTTVVRRMVFANGRAYYDTPGVRSIGNYLNEVGLGEVFSDVIELAHQCRFRDCTHTIEPDCAVSQAIANQAITRRRVDSYLSLAAEVTGDDRLV